MTGLLLAHAGEGATWQALLTVISVGLLVLFVMAIVGRLELTTLGDLTLPLAFVAVVASLAPVAGDVMSDAAPWAVPAGAVLLVTLVYVAATGRRLAPTSPLVIGAIALALVLSLALAPTLVDAWYPPAATTTSLTSNG